MRIRLEQHGLMALGNLCMVPGGLKSSAGGKIRCITMIKTIGDLTVKLDFDYLKLFEMPVEKVSHSQAYWDTSAAHEILKKKEN